MGARILVFIKRNPALTPEGFRHMYETGHSRLAVRLFGHLWSSYKRHYLGSANSFADVKGAPVGATSPDQVEGGYDVITELVFKDERAMEENNRILAENRAIIEEDEERTFDRAACWLVMCDTVEEDLSQAPGRWPLQD